MTAAAPVLAEPGAARDRELVTPEGIPLRFRIARAGDRAGAFFFDCFVQAIAMFLLFLLTVLTVTARERDATLAPAFWFLAWFLVRTFYFTWFELRWRGATPGKRRAGIRVMDAGGGPLTAEAIIVRNLTREVEIWVPLVILMAPRTLLPPGPGWMVLAAGAWALVLGFMPLFNRDRMRVGDMVAGTLVVVTPRATLLPDLGGQEIRRQAKRETAYAFTDAQLDVYGIYELQVLEDLLRRRDPYKRQAMQAVCDRIARKIDWQGRTPRPERFLREFYAGLRARLEKKMLLGKRKRDKHSRE